jgi:uncharacterized protein with von Willebrand factor type A (vWA) domain
VKGVLVEDYRNPAYRSLAKEVSENMMLRNRRIPLAVVLDATIIHYKPWTDIVFNPRVESSWKRVLQKYHASDEYRRLNSMIAGDPLMVKYATIHFLNRLYDKSGRELWNTGVTPSEKDRKNPVEAIFMYVDTLVSNNMHHKASIIIDSIVSELKREAEETKKDVEAVESFSHSGLPVAELLERPEEFREKARNEIVVNLVRFLQKLRREAVTPKQATMPTLVGGRPLGLKKMQRWSEMVSIYPVDFVDEDLLAYKVASRTLRVTERYGGVQDYVVYLDKSGSMAGKIPYRATPTRVELVPKISFATASALALASRLKRYGAKAILKLFDVEVHDPITDMNTIIDTLMKVKADRGTNISRVLEDATRYRDDRIVVVTDGIDEVSEESVRKARSLNLDVTFIFIKTSNELLKKNFKSVYIEEARPEILLTI